MQIVDSHVHIFKKIAGFAENHKTRSIDSGRVLIGEVPIQFMPPMAGATVHTPEMLMNAMDSAGVSMAVLLQGPFYGECNKYVLAAERKFPDRFLSIAYIDPWNGELSSVNSILQSDEYHGVKIEFSCTTGLSGLHPGVRLNDSSIKWLWLKLEKRGMVLTLDLGAVGSESYQTAAVREIAEEYSALKIVIAHLAQPNPSVMHDNELRRQWLEQIRLGTLPNVWFDTSSLPAYLKKERFPFSTCRDYLATAIEQTGPAKIMWGSDIPGLLPYATYPQLVEIALQHIGFLDEEEQALIMGENALTVYGEK